MTCRHLFSSRSRGALRTPATSGGVARNASRFPRRRAIGTLPFVTWSTSSARVWAHSISALHATTAETYWLSRPTPRARVAGGRRVHRVDGRHESVDLYGGWSLPSA